MGAVYLIGLVAPTLGQSTSTSSFGFIAAATSISAELSSPTFVPYSKPANDQKVDEFITLGDSYTAGTGCNGINDVMAGDAVRGKQSYPMQMAAERDNWGFINGDETLPRFSFHAYTGDTTVELVSNQLTQWSYKENNINLPRARPLGSHKLLFVTIGCNDAGLSNILNDCIYRAWFPGDCKTTLNKLQKDIDDSSLRDKINYALYDKLLSYSKK